MSAFFQRLVEEVKLAMAHYFYHHISEGKQNENIKVLCNFMYNKSSIHTSLTATQLSYTYQYINHFYYNSMQHTAPQVKQESSTTMQW